MKTIAITGASGFVGQHLLVTLMHHSNYNIRVLVRKKRSPEHKMFDNDRVEVFDGDLTKRDSLIDFVQPGCTLINLAYLNSNDLNDNITAINNLIYICKRKKIKKFIHCSTAAVSGRISDDVINENTICNPLNEYEKTKFEIENTLLRCHEKAFELVILRPTAIYGPGVRNLMKLASELTGGNWFLCYLRTILFNRRKMNLVSIENVTRAIMHLVFIEKAIDREIYYVSDDNLPNNNYRDVESLLRKYLDVNDYSIPVIPLPQSLLSTALLILGRSNINPARVYSSEKLKSTGYKNRIFIEDGIALFAKWYKQEVLKRKSGKR